jgi:cytochrome c553
MLRWIKRIVLAVLALTALLVALVYAASERMLRRKYDVAPARIAIPNDRAAIARGEHLARAVTSCSMCHGDDGGGALYMDAGPIGRLVGPNLTSGRSGPPLSDADWVRALRHGVRADGRSLMVMPSEVSVHLSADDVGALVAYYRALPPVQRDLPRSKFGPLGRALLASGKMNVLVAGKTPQIAPAARVPIGATVEYGRYLADIAGCHGCHGHGLSGGRVAGPPNLPPASNLTPAALASWSQADFARALREGKRQNGTTLNEFMPWRTFAHMTDEEVEAVWLYLKSVPGKAFGNK